jgi:hypothetical protein
MSALKWLPLVTNWEELERLHVAVVNGGSERLCITGCVN